MTMTTGEDGTEAGHFFAPDERCIGIKALAKLNLTLAVGPLRADGYHSLDSLMVPLSLADDVVVRPADGLSLTVEGPTADGVPDGPENLVWRAAERLAREAGVQANAAIRIVKRIPVGGGLGGGSSDAAATLLALNRLWQLELDGIRLSAVAADVGSDVPFCLTRRPARVSGRGETVEPLTRPLPPLWAVLAPGQWHVSTAEVYAALDKLRQNGKLPPPRTFDLAGLTLRNDLETPAAAVCEPMGRLLQQLRATGLDRMMVAGSGSTLFAIFDNEEQANHWEDRIRVHAPARIATVLSGAEG